MPIYKKDADEAFDSATCIGCGACVATCKNASAMLFVSAKINQYSKLPQGQVEHNERVKNMTTQMDDEGFGSCTNTGACEVDCPKEISINKIANLFGGKKTFIPKRPREPKRSLANISKIKKDINWKPTITIQEGIKRLLKN